jgi:hypothetical protein
MTTHTKTEGQFEELENLIEEAKANARITAERDNLREQVKELLAVVKAWQEWSEGKRAWPKIETNLAIAKAENHQ